MTGMRTEINTTETVETRFRKGSKNAPFYWAIYVFLFRIFFQNFYLISFFSSCVSNRFAKKENKWRKMGGKWSEKRNLKEDHN